MRFTLAKLLPETAKGLIEMMEQRFPEPRYDPAATDDAIRFALARRSVVLEIREAYALAQKRAG